MIKKTLTLSFLSLALLSCSSKKQYILKIQADKSSMPKETIVKKLGISSVTLPNYLLKYPIAKRIADNQIEYLNNHIWADRLDEALKRELLYYLQNYSTQSEVLNYPWSRLPDVTVDITINEYIALQNSIVLKATIKIYHRQKDQNSIHVLNLKESFSGKDEDIAKAMSSAFEKLSYKIAIIIAQK